MITIMQDYKYLFIFKFGIQFNDQLICEVNSIYEYLNWRQS